VKIAQYLETAHATDQLPDASEGDRINPYLGLAGEIGALLTALKKEVRSNAPTAEATRATVKDELGDITWYAVTVAKRANVDFHKEVLLGNLQWIVGNFSEDGRSPAPLLGTVLESGGEVAEAISGGITSLQYFGDYQDLAVKTSKFKNRDALILFLVQIWGNVADLLKPFGDNLGKLVTTPYPPKLTTAKALGDIMWYVSAFAHLYNHSLNDVMAENAAKIVSAFPTEGQKKRTALFDEDLGALRQIPRKFVVDFVDESDEIAYMFINGVRVGDPLTNNSRNIDGYRFHDAVHLAFVAILGWSPVMRSLLQRKRKGIGDLDEVEDGARARIVDEMIVKIAHSYAVGFGDRLLDGKRHVNLNLLKDIVSLADGLEVAVCKYWEWEEAILRGFQIYNQLRNVKGERRGGRVTVNLRERSICFAPPGDEESRMVPL